MALSRNHLLSAESGTRSVTRRFHSLLASGRLHLAFKAALAAGTAWFLAPFMPGVAADYPYYAPLGALVCMYPTVAGSVKQGFQTLVGLIMGIGLAFVIIALGEPATLTVSLAVGLGVLIAGMPRLGAGRDWIPMAALFVLVLGGDNPDDFSFGYALQMLTGVIVGVTVNVLVFPPLHFSGAAQGIEQLKGALARQLRDMGTAMAEEWPPKHEDWAARESRLSQLSADVRQAVQLAETSRRANFRSRLRPRDMSSDRAALDTLSRVTFYVEDMTEVLSGVIWRSPKETPVPLPLSEPLAQAMSAAGDAVANWNDADKLTAAEEALQELRRDMHRTASEDQPVDATGSLALSLRRILSALASRM